jgi:lipid A ethanolaminephosphotransferase
MTTRRKLGLQPAREPGWNPLSLALLAGLWVAALPNWPLWQALIALPETASPRGAVFVAGFAAIIAVFTALLLTPFAWRGTIKPAIGFVVISAALGAYFMGTYNVVIDTTMMTNVVQTDVREVRDLLNLRLVAGLSVMAGLPLLLLWRVRMSGPGGWLQAGRNLSAGVAMLLLIAALVLALFADLSSTMRNHRTLRYLVNPLNSFYALVDMGVQARARPSGPPAVIGADAHILTRAPGSKPPLIVLVIGETARADHFGSNGYARPTNPETAAQGAISFGQVMSCGTNTAASLPCMFSHLGKAAFESRHHDYENLLDLVQRAGMAVLWLDNQAGCKGLCERVPHADTRNVPPGASALPTGLCDSEECLDAALLYNLDQRLAALPAAARDRGVLLVLHQMGSHGPAYARRSPSNRKPFEPECTTNVLQQCDNQALINAYDNSITYTDHVLGQTIAWLKQQAAAHDGAMLYVSDHGESLGENNLYLHGLPYTVAPIEQKHVPMLLWVSPQTLSDMPLRLDCLQAARGNALSHDNLFHTTLGLLGIRAAEYQARLDAFAACRVR